MRKSQQCRKTPSGELSQLAAITGTPEGLDAVSGTALAALDSDRFEGQLPMARSNPFNKLNEILL